MPVPSPDKGGGFEGEASDLPIVKETSAPRTKDVASDGTDCNDDDRAGPRKKRVRKTKPIRIATWNVTSFNNREQEVITELEKHKIDICSLSETKKRRKGNIRIGDYILIYNGRNKNERAASGVGLLIQDKLEENIKDITYFSDRLLQTTLQLHKTKTTYVISTYAPDINKPKEERDKFYDDLQSMLNSIPKQGEVVIMGDFNARIDSEVLSGIKNSFNEDTVNDNDEQLIHLCAQNELRINNTYYPPKPQHKYTFENTRGHKSIIDYIITNRNVHPSRILDVRVLNSANTGTDHNLVLMKMRGTIRRRSRVEQTTAEKLNVESLSDDSTKHLYQQRLNQKIDRNEIQEEDNVWTAWEKLRLNIIGAAEEALDKRKINRSGKQRTKPWFKEEIKALAAEKRESYIRHRSGNTGYDSYKTTRNRVNEEIRKIKHQFWEKYSIDMEHDLYGGQKKVWKTLRNRKRVVNKFVQITTITTEEWEKYFRNLYGEAQLTPRQDTDTPNAECTLLNNWQIPKDRLEMAIHKLKNRKAPGPDSIGNELLKYGGGALTKELHSFFNKILTHKEVPQEWRESITIPIFKKGEKTNPKNCRGISLLSTTAKLMIKIISDERTGFAEEQ
ncbi:uncharacterized protein [Anoplolepis gracilipes]|uniref:uncharacterized protein n=1 Tax=Anoplolepis gracilipes TaxID=354296 RepID=UPI003BA1CEE1